MKFTFEIKDEDFDFFESEEDFKAHIEEAIKDRIASQYDWSINFNLKNEVSEIVRQHKDEIIKKAITELVDRIEKKKEIVANTPKAKEIAALNKDNEKYFMELIDKAIAKRFK